MTNPSMPAPQPQDRMSVGRAESSPVEQPVAEQGAVPQRAQVRQFAFDGGAATYLGTAILGVLVTVFTLGICYPYALVLRERWRAKHSYIEGRQLVFNGSAWALFGLWWKWLILIIITVGVYGFWVGPRLYRWKWENTSWARQIPTPRTGMPG